MREQSRLHVQITLKELVLDALMFGFLLLLLFFFRSRPYVRKTNHSEGSRCVTETSTVKRVEDGRL